jgi:hypothetical protein
VKSRAARLTASTEAAPRDLTQLSRELMLRAALQIIDLDGGGGPSMRRLGAAWGRDPMSPYLYAAKKTALLDGVAELVLTNSSSIAPTMIGVPATSGRPKFAGSPGLTRIS